MNLPAHRIFSLPVKGLCIALLSALSISTYAHEVWIEDTPDGKLVVRFAEYGDDFEKSPGALDALNPISAWSVRGGTQEQAGGPAKSREEKERQLLAQEKSETAEIRKNSDHFLLAGLTPDKPAHLEADFTVMGAPGTPEKPARKPLFYARWQPLGVPVGKPSLNFDILRTGKEGEAQIFFRGKPLASVKVQFHPPGGMEQDLTSDAEGLIHFDESKPGFYLLVGAHQRETSSGYSRGVAYDAISHNCTLSWRKP